MLHRMARLTISIPDEYVAAGKRTAARENTTISAIAARAVRNEILRRDVARLVADGMTGPDDEWLALAEEAHEE